MDRLQSLPRVAAWAALVLASGAANAVPRPETPVLIHAPEGCVLNHYSHATATATDGAGLWIHAWTSELLLRLSRSTDNALTWGPPIEAATYNDPDTSYVSMQPPLLAAGENGIWMLAWTAVTEDDSQCEGDVWDGDGDAEGKWKTEPLRAKCEPTPYTGTDLRRSTDGGQTWQPAIHVSGHVRGLHPLGGGHWIRVVDEGNRISVADSDNDGVTWANHRDMVPAGMHINGLLQVGCALDGVGVALVSEYYLLNGKLRHAVTALHTDDAFQTVGSRRVHTIMDVEDAYHALHLNPLGAALHLGGAEWLVAWVGKVAAQSPRSVLAARTSDGGQTWGAAFSLAGEQHSFGLASDRDGGLLMVRGQDGATHYVHTYSADGGLAFTPEQVLPVAKGTGEIGAQALQLVHGGGQYLATWTAVREDCLIGFQATRFLEGSAPEGETPVEGEGMQEGEAPPPPHSADVNGDGRIGLSELLRAVQFYNSPGYHCDPGGEDGYNPGADAAARQCAPHASDFAPLDWRIDLAELLRLIQFYNTGAYHRACGTEDGFAPGPGPAPPCD